MKKIFFICVCTMMMVTAGSSAKADVLDKIALYLPNRFLDALDTFTVSLGVGPVIRAELHATRGFAFRRRSRSESYGYKRLQRQYGVGREEGYDISFAMFNRVNLTRDGQSRLVQPFTIDEDGFPCRISASMSFYNGARDYWGIGEAWHWASPVQLLFTLSRLPTLLQAFSSLT